MAAGGGAEVAEGPQDAEAARVVRRARVMAQQSRRRQHRGSIHRVFLAVPQVAPAFPLHAAAGAHGEGFAGNAHRHAPEAWLASVKYLVEEMGADVNMRDDGGYTPLHHAAARGDVEVINYLVSKGADVKAVSRRGQTTADMANGPVSRISPYPEALALLVKLGAINNNKCASCNP